MAREVGKLAAVALRSLPVGRHSDRGGLYLQVTQNAVGNKARSWLFRYSLTGKSREMGLGPLHTLGLAEARAKAREIISQAPQCGHTAIVEQWRQLPDGQIELTMRRLRTAD